jgi:large subunit ribosomal protein L27
MAHTASTGSAKRTVDVAGKRLGIKKFGEQYVKSGEIIVRQRGSLFYPGKNTSQGRDFTIYATQAGFVYFRRMKGYKRNQKYVDILPVKMSASVEVKTVEKSDSTEVATMEAPVTEIKTEVKKPRVAKKATTTAKVSKPAKAKKTSK